MLAIEVQNFLTHVHIKVSDMDQIRDRSTIEDKHI